MRQDQYERLQSLHEELADVFIGEADPKKWPGAGLAPAALDSKTRGDRYWSKKNAVATIALMMRITGLTALVQQAGTGGGAAAVTDENDQLDQDVKDAEKQAAKLLDAVARSSSKAAFDARVHGKA
jgi:hypothetical protein